MAIYKLLYAQDHLTELFEEASTGEDVIIIRTDGRRCSLVRLDEEKEAMPLADSLEIPTAAESALAPA